jgi:hypothetical protein
MREKERKRLLSESESKVIKLKDYPKKDISFLKAVHMVQREGLVEEIFEHLLGEYNNLLKKLERYGENSKFWERSKSFIYAAKDSNAESKRPSEAWLRSKVKFYESQTSF